MTARLLDQLPGTVFTAGDNALPDGSASAFTDCYAPTWGRHLARTRPAPGERDWATKDLAGYLGYFGAAAAPDGPTWYSYDLGSWHIVVLDSACADVGGCTADSDQGRWLAKDLAASKATCTLAIWHRPLASSGVEGGDPEVAPFWDSLYAAHAEVVVNAHDRDYERFAPQDPGGHADRASGIRQFVVGTGGAALAGFGPPAANSEFRLAGEHGVLRLILREKDYAWTFVPSDGTVTDGGQAACH
jgi:acid phosphatase type 7